jgi:hypothetical protein
MVNENRRLIMSFAHLLKPSVRRVVVRALSLPPRGGVRNDALGLKSFRVSGHCLQLEWRAREIHPWDRDLPASRQAELFSEQALKDTDAAIIRLFQMLPEIEEIKLQVVKPMSFGGVIFTGIVDRGRALAPKAPPSLKQRLIALGVHYKMGGDHLVILPANSWGPMLNHGGGGLRSTCAS